MDFPQSANWARLHIALKVADSVSNELTGAKEVIEGFLRESGVELEDGELGKQLDILSKVITEEIIGRSERSEPLYLNGILGDPLKFDSIAETAFQVWVGMNKGWLPEDVRSLRGEWAYTEIISTFSDAAGEGANSFVSEIEARRAGTLMTRDAKVFDLMARGSESKAARAVRVRDPRFDVRTRADERQALEESRVERWRLNVRELVKRAETTVRAAAKR